MAIIAGMEVRVVRRADHDRVDLLLQLVQHPAEVGVLLGPGELLVGLAGPLVVHVAQGHEVLAGQPLQVVPAAAADPDAGQVQFFVRRTGGVDGGSGAQPVAGARRRLFRAFDDGRYGCSSVGSSCVKRSPRIFGTRSSVSQFPVPRLPPLAPPSAIDSNQPGNCKLGGGVKRQLAGRSRQVLLALTRRALRPAELRPRGSILLRRDSARTSRTLVDEVLHFQDSGPPVPT